MASILPLPIILTFFPQVADNLQPVRLQRQGVRFTFTLSALAVRERQLTHNMAAQLVEWIQMNIYSLLHIQFPNFINSRYSSNNFLMLLVLFNSLFWEGEGGDQCNCRYSGPQGLGTHHCGSYQGWRPEKHHGCHVMPTHLEDSDSLPTTGQGHLCSKTPESFCSVQALGSQQTLTSHHRGLPSPPAVCSPFLKASRAELTCR